MKSKLATTIKLGLSALFLSSAVFAQQNVSEKSCVQARQVVDAGVKALGGARALQSINDISRRLEGTRTEIGQSMRPGLPYDTEPYSINTVMDLRGGRSVGEVTVNILGGNQLKYRQVVKDANTAFFVNLRSKTVYPSGPASFAAGPSTPNRYPELLLRMALARPQNLRWVGEEDYEGARQRVIILSDPYGTELTLYFNEQTGLLSKVETIVAQAVSGLRGEAVQEFVFSDYREVSGVKIPFRYVTKYGGEVLEEMKLAEIKINVRPADALFEVPEGFEKMALPPPSPVFTRMGDGVYFVEAAYNSMFVVFKDYVLVLEGPLGDGLSQTVIAKIKEVAPNKPIKYVVSTHYHYDHIGGVRGYIAEGTTIVTTPLTKGVIEKLAATERLIRPDSLSRNPREPAFETFSDKRVFTDGQQTVELYNIGPTPHVAEMIIAYLPKEKAVFVADLFDIQPGQIPPASDDTFDFAEKIRKLNLQVESIVPVHGRLGSINDLRRALELRRDRVTDIPSGHNAAVMFLSAGATQRGVRSMK
ncbi:MAG: MBL fold metallo-hydrolase [Acidobacteriota bacterium]|nr:MBL fold metallo-hydrolase [Acidobacteriota bacterium]